MPGADGGWVLRVLRVCRAIPDLKASKASRASRALRAPKATEALAGSRAVAPQPMCLAQCPETSIWIR